MRARFPSVFSLPLVRRPSDVLLAHLGDGMRVLDVGAGPGKAGRRIRARFPGIEYRSLDTDPDVRADFRSVEEVRGTFDRVILFEVLEHLEVAEGMRLLARIPSFLERGGLLLASTPNVFHPSAFFRDATHRTPLAYDEFAGMAASAGFRVREIFRVYNAPWLHRAVRRALAAPLHRLLGVDYARSIVLVAEAPGEAGPRP